MYTRISAPLAVQWELTSWCTYNCVHCYNYWRRNSKPRKLLSEHQLNVHRKACREIVNNKVFGVTLTGGEPLAVIEQLLPELKYLSENSVDMTINTNLALMTKEIGTLLDSVNIHAILTSLMSCNSTINDEIAQRKGAFKRTVAGIRMARSMGFTIGVNMVVTQKNIHTIYETGKLAYELGAETFSATKAAKPANCPNFSAYALNLPQLRHMFVELLRIRDDFGIKVDSLEHYPACAFPNTDARTEFGGRSCSAGKTGATIGFDGGIRPCSHCPISYGNVAADGIQKSWDNMACWRDDSIIPKVCMTTCEEAPSRCSGGCRVEAMNAGRGIGGVDPFCLAEYPSAERLFEEIEPIPEGSRVQLSSDVRFREENFGYIAFRSRNNKWTAMDATLRDLLQRSLTDEPISADVISEIYQSPLVNAVETLSILKHLGLVVLV